MNNNDPNKIVSSLYREFLGNYGGVSIQDAAFWAKRSELKERCANIANVVGAIEVMNKNSLLKLLSMESSLRFMEPFRFLNLCAKAAEDLNLK
jgi:hypothetical protein